MDDITHDVSRASSKPVDRAARQASRLDTPDKGKLRVFISYSRDDLYFADQLDAALDACGLISEADTVVFVLSPASARSEICAWEVEEAARLGKRILPVNCRPLEGASPRHGCGTLTTFTFMWSLRCPTQDSAPASPA